MERVSNALVDNNTITTTLPGLLAQMDNYDWDYFMMGLNTVNPIRLRASENITFTNNKVNSTLNDVSASYPTAQSVFVVGCENVLVDSNEFYFIDDVTPAGKVAYLYVINFGFDKNTTISNNNFDVATVAGKDSNGAAYALQGVESQLDVIGNNITTTSNGPNLGYYVSSMWGGSSNSYVANNTIRNCSIHTERLAGGIQVYQNSIVIDNYVEIVNNGYAMYVTSNCTIKNNTLISLGGGIDVARLDNYNNTITGNNITCQNGYNIKITASGNLIENNTLVNTNSASGTKISVVYIYGKQAMDNNRIISNTIITNTAYVAYLQGNATNTLIAYNHITTNNSNPFYERKYGSGASNAQYPVNTTIINDDITLPIMEVNITDESYSIYFEDNGYLINGALPEKPGLQTVLIIHNITNKSMIFNSRVSIDGQSLGNITNCTISFEPGSSGSKLENLIMNYVHDGEKWVAMDGNYNAENVYFDEDIEIVARQMPEDKDNFLPFKNVENSTNPMPSFGQGFNIHVTGLTHDERGYPDTNDPDTHTKLVERLCNKVLMHRKDICSVKKENCDDADIVVVSCGSPYRSVGAARRPHQLLLHQDRIRKN